ncbi:MAG: MMPL family transporter [Gemmataceae bacterium]|nr:MMPL family transporter [Gemmataceae bacterium]
MDPESTAPHRTGLVPRLLAGLVNTVCNRPRAVLVVALLCCAASAYAATFHLQYQTQRSDLISPHKDCQQRWHQYLAEFGDDDDMVVCVQGGDRKRMELALDSVAARVREQPQLFDRLFYKVDLRGLHNRALLFLPVEQIKSIQDNLQSMKLLLEFAPISWRSLSLLSLLRETRHRLAQLDMERPLSTSDTQFLMQFLAITRTASATLDDPAEYKNPWGALLTQQPEQKDLMAEPQYFFSGDGGLAFLLARPVKEVGSFTAAEKSVAAMRRIVAEVKPEFPEIEFGLTGLPVLETDEMVAAQRDTHIASVLAIGGVLLLFFLVYRSVWYPLLTIVTLLVGTAWAMGWVTLTVGHLNILSATFAVMLIGMGDYGVLWVMRYEQARQQGMDVRAALLHTTTHVAVGNLTAAATLALAFFAAMFADFKAVAELGWIAGCGVLLCALACFTVLPALCMIFDRRVIDAQPDDAEASLRLFSPLASAPAAPRSWLPWISRHPRWVIGGGIATVLALAAMTLGVRYDHNLLHLQARNLDSVKWEMTLIEHTAGASWHSLSYTSTPEEALALKARYEKLPEVSRVVEVASLVPRDQGHKLEMLRDIQARLRRLPPRGVPIAHSPPDLDEIKQELAGLITWLRPVIKSGRHPVLTELNSSLLALHRRGDPIIPWEGSLEDFIAQLEFERRVASRLGEFDERLASDLSEDLHRLLDVSTPAAITLADMPADLRERYIGKNGKWLLRVFARDCLWDFPPLEHFVEQIRTVDPEATGKPFATVEGLRAMKNGFQWAGVYALLAIIAVLFLDFRKPRHTLIALTPLVMGVIMTLGIMGICRLPLNPANMIAFPLILGVGVDNGVHVLHDYLIRRRKGLTSISYPIGRGVLVKAMTTMIGFGALMISTQQGLVSLGFILALGVGCCMLTSLVFLPAVLNRLGTRHRAAERRASVRPRLAA